MIEMIHPDTTIYMAPFQGITGQVFRSCYAKYFVGVDKMYTPYFAGINHDSRISEKKTFELRNKIENIISVVPQILSKDAGEIIRFAHIIEHLGFTELNWNLGCPFPQVANKKRGSGMLPSPELIDEILYMAIPEMNINLSIKCRLGYFSAEEFDALIPVFNRHRISELTIHPRIGKQLYRGSADIDTFAVILPKMKMPIVYNGDIFTSGNYNQLKNRFPTISSWMIGRGLLSDPFLPARVKGLELPEDREKHLRKFIEELYLCYRKQMNDQLSALGFMKEYWQYFSASFEYPNKALKKIKKTRSFDEYEDVVAEIFEKGPVNLHFEKFNH